MVSAYIQLETAETQVKISKYTAELNPARKGYAKFMSGIVTSYDYAKLKMPEKMVKSLDEIEISYYSFEPMLTTQKRESIYSQIQQFSGLCYKRLSENNLSKEQEKNIEKVIFGIKNISEKISLMAYLTKTPNKKIKSFASLIGTRQKRRAPY